MHIVLKWISPRLFSNTRFLLDSAFAGIYGNDCHSPSHTHADVVCVGICALLLKRRCTSNCFRGALLSGSSPLSLSPLSPSLIRSLPLFPFIPPPLSASLPSRRPSSHIVSLALLSSLTPSLSRSLYHRLPGFHPKCD